MASDKSFKNWLVFFSVGNAVLLLLIWFCFPSAGFNLERAHVRLVVNCGVSTGVLLLVLSLGIFWPRLRLVSVWGVELLQGYRLLPAGEAMRYWPGGDDGPGLGWGMFVHPLMWVLFIIGFFVCCQTFLPSQTQTDKN